jgi:hypothetical protein
MRFKYYIQNFKGFNVETMLHNNFHNFFFFFLTKVTNCD